MSRIKELKGEPSLAALMGRAVATSMGRGGAVPDLEITRRDVAIDPAALADYDRVCGFTLRDTLPSTYIHVLTFPLQVALFADRAFPYPLAGAVHLSNRIVQHRPVGVSESLRLAVHAEPAREHKRGATVDLIGEAYVGDEQVWGGRSTYLYRGQKVEGEAVAGAEADAPRVGSADAGRASEAGRDHPGTRWHLPADLGRKYAKVSGDVNPIHMGAWSAKAMGFPRAIAHGMWSAARMLATVENRVPGAYAFDVAFAKPVLLPSTVRLVTQASDGGYNLTLRSDKKDTVHAVARVGEA